MASFEDKLDDNKVEKWKEHYVNYGQMRAMLVTIKGVAEAYESLAKSRPDVAAEFGPSSAEVGLERGLNAMSIAGGDEDEDEGTGSENKSLVETVGKGGEYGSTGGEIDGDELAFRQNFAMHKKALDNVVAQFKSGLIAERSKAAIFYIDEVAGLERRLDLLISTVQSNYELKKDPKRNRRTVMRKQRRDSMILMKSARTLISEKHDVSDIGVIIDEEDDIDDQPISVRNVVNEMESVKRALVDLHRQTILLFNFFMMTRSALLRLLKRFNAILPKQKWDEQEVFPERYDGRKTKNLIDRIVKIYAKWFCDNDIREATAQMHTKKGDDLELDWSQFRLGHQLGICLTLTVWLAFDCLWSLWTQGIATLAGRSAFPVFRGCFGLLVWHWCWGVSAYVWRRYRINYIYLFDFNPKTVLYPHAIFNACVDETMVFLVTLLLYYKSSTHTMPVWFAPGIYPALLVLYMLSRLIFPLKQRRPLWTAIMKVWTAPLFSPTFFETYVADVFTSLVKVLLDLLWTVCFIFSGDFLLPDQVDTAEDRHGWQHAKWYKNIEVIICLFPLYIRLMQCLRKFYDSHERVPHLPNAFKYTMSQVVTLFGKFYPVLRLSCSKNSVSCGHMSAFQVTWLEIFIFSSMYSWVWDVKMDWGLGKKDYNWLGPRLMFPSTLHYYGVIVADLFLRFMWMQSLVPPSSGAHFELPAYLTAVSMVLELIRRTLWSFFRLENEHRTRTQHYGEKDDIDFVPFHFTTGHNHKYQQNNKRSGRTVLVEVLAVGISVLVLCSVVVIIAQKASAQEF